MKPPPPARNKEGEGLVAGTSEATTEVRSKEARAKKRLCTLLYVEDNPANIELVEQVIRLRPDLQLMTAADGTLGIELARSTLPTVILMDINLPGISGLKALKILREDSSTAHIPVVALTASAMQRDIASGMEAGFFRYLTKPFKIEGFMETLNAALASAERTPGQTDSAGRTP